MVVQVNSPTPDIYQESARRASSSAKRCQACSMERVVMQAGDPRSADNHTTCLQQVNQKNRTGRYRGTPEIVDTYHRRLRKQLHHLTVLSKIELQYPTY
jgi:endonuclease IV